VNLLLPLLLLSFPTQEPVQEEDSSAPFASWQEEYGEWILHSDPARGAARFLYGGTIEAPWTVKDPSDLETLAREAFDHSFPMFRIADSTLVHAQTKHLDLSRIGTSDKWAVRFIQVHQGIEVVGASVHALFGPGGALLALDSGALPGVEDLATRPLNDPFAALQAAHLEYFQIEGREADHFEHPVLVIYPHLNGKTLSPRLAWEIEMATRQVEGLPSGRKIFMAADQRVPGILGEENQVHEQGISGHVDSWATPGTAPDKSNNPETQRIMRWMDITSSAGNTTTDGNGDFSLPGATSNADITFRYRGDWGRVMNSSGSEYSFTQSFSPGTNSTALLNDSRTEHQTAEANAFKGVNDFHAWVKRIDPADTTMDFQVLANVNQSSTCNAYYDGSSINFYSSGNGCVNTAYSTVVAHEEGHWANVRYGSGNGSDGFGEGAADVWGMYIYDDPIVGFDFCGTGCNVRDGNNTRQFCGDSNPGCHSGVHANGEVLMGALWKVRENLNTALGNAAGDLVADTLMLSWFNAYDDGQIRSWVEDHWLALDDNDGNIFNGTPNFADINDGFLQQGFPGIDLDLIQIDHTPLDDTQDEAGPYVVQADITPLVGNAITSADVVWSVNGGTETRVSMTSTGSFGFTLDIPGQVSPARVNYRIEAEDDLGNSENLPRTGDFQFVIGVYDVVYFNDFEATSDEGWTHGQNATQDDWQRGDPFGKSGSAQGVAWQDPQDAFSGLQCWCNDIGDSGWNGSYKPNVDNWLESASIDCSGKYGVKLGFARWLSIEEGAYDHARILVNGTEVWTNPVNGHIQETGWSEQEVDISSLADNNSDVRVRFTLDSDGGLELGGWAIDDFQVFVLGPVGGGDSITLTGPGFPAAGSQVTYTISGAPASSSFGYFRGRFNTGSTIMGHDFDIGSPWIFTMVGPTDGTGAGSFSGTIPIAASGLTLYLEAAAQDASGNIFDSNILQVDIQ